MKETVFISYLFIFGLITRQAWFREQLLVVRTDIGDNIYREVVMIVILITISIMV